MNRNTTFNLNQLPKVNIQRSIFPFKFGHKTSFNVGEVIPFMVQEIIPGSTYSLNTACVVRLQTLKTPIMDNVYMDTYYFFTPMSLVFDKTAQLFGENDAGPWTMDKVDYQIPHLTYPKPHPAEGEVDNTHGWDSGSIADYMGIPINISDDDFGQNMTNKDFPMALPFRCYAKIINEFFRDQNLQQPIVINTDDQVREGKARGQADGSDWYVTDLELGGKPFIAARFHNYFSSCLPAPQKSPDVSIFGGFANNNSTSAYSLGDNDIFAPVITRAEFVDSYSNITANTNYNENALSGWRRNNSSTSRASKIFSQANDTQLFLSDAGGTISSPSQSFIPGNLWANLNIPEATISNLRMAFQLQKYFEKLAHGGSRFREYLAEFFGVFNGDARMHVPEYLGGHRFPLSIHQVANQSETSEAKLGDLGAMSNTSDVHDDVHMSFSEPGYLIGLCVVRYDNTFSQGLERMWSRRTALDFYNPVFANISDQPVYKREISLGIPDWLPDGTSGPQTPDEVFGYAPAWQDYRVKPSRVSGEMRPEAQNSLASWHLADDYEYAPTLDGEWIQTDKNIVDRVLDVTSEVSNQVFADFYVSGKMVLPMPVHSIPGLADHH